MFIIALVYSISIFLGHNFLNGVLSFYDLRLLILSAFPVLLFLHLMKKVHTFSLVLLIVFFLTGIGQSCIHDHNIRDRSWTAYKGDQLILRIISKSLTSNGSKLICRVLYRGVDLDNLNKSRGKIILNGDSSLYRNIQILSDYHCLKKIYPTSENLNPLAFNYRDFLERKMILGQIYLKSSDQIFLLKENNGVFSRILSWRYRFSSILLQRFRDPTHSGILSAMTLGVRDHISPEIYTMFRNTGAVHILAVSGLHVGIIATMLILLLRNFNSSIYLLNLAITLIIIAGVWIYVVLSGSAPSSVRAGIMFTAYYSGLKSSKPINSLNIIGLCALIMLLINPMEVYDLGFQFSFCALLGIVLFFNKIKNLISMPGTPARIIWQLACISLSAQVFVAPLSIFYFNQFPNYFVLSGIVTTPFAGLLITLGFLNIGFQLLNVPVIVSKVLVISSEFILELFASIIIFINNLPASVMKSLFLSEFSLLFILFSLILFALYIYKKKYLLLLCSFLLMTFQSALHVQNKHSQNSKKKMVVYDLYNESVSDLFVDGHLIIIQADSITNNACKNCMKFRLSNFPQETNRIFLDKSSRSLCINNLHLMFYPENDMFCIPSNETIDILVVNNKSMEVLKRIIASNNVAMVVLDSTIKQESGQIKQWLKASDISYYHTGTSGPYIIDFS